MTADFHALCVAGTHSGVGKTTLALGLMAALAARGLTVQPFKCGPDYLDAGHHGEACGRASRNLDTWMMGEKGVRKSYALAVRNADAAVVEGVMGLFDGASAVALEGSTAHVAALLDLPILLVVDAKGMARSVAALVSGYARFLPDLRCIGVIANNVRGERHAAILRDALEAATGPPLLGAFPQDERWKLPERHLGLVPAAEGNTGAGWFRDLGAAVERHLDIDGLLAATSLRRPAPPPQGPQGSGRVRLAVARDAAFHFYYQDNLDLLRGFGAELVEFSPLSDSALPAAVDGLYIGGGFPELFAQQLEANAAMRTAVARFAAAGGSLYAECGGFMYLCRSLTDAAGKSWEMCGVLAAATRMRERRVRLGYVRAETLRDGLFGPAGTRLRGHEFHWSDLIAGGGDREPLFEVRCADGTDPRRAGIGQGRVWASYLHLHFASNPEACRAWLRQMKGLP